MFPDLSTVNTIAYDTETTGLDIHKDYPIGYVITWGMRPEESKYYPIRHEGGGNLEPGPVIDFIRRTLCRSDLRVVMHNAAFDLWMSHKDGITINGAIEDTGLNDPLIDENNKKYNLEACCARAKVQAKKAEQMYEYLAERFGGKATREQMANFYKLSGEDPMAVEYAEGDGTSTLQLWDWQQKELDKQELRRVWNIECGLIPVLHRSRLRGFPIQEDELDRLHSRVKVMRKEAVDKIGGINPKAPSEVGPYIASIATKGKSDELPPSLSKTEREAKILEMWNSDIIPVPERTKPSSRFPNGQLSFNKDYLAGFPEGELINDVRKIGHLEDSFIIPLKERHVHNGLIHPNFWQLASDDYGTVTGRLSCSDPNLQQVTKRDKKLGPIFRRVFVPPEGRILEEKDYEQCEYRLFAHYSKSKILIERINQPGSDVHKIVGDILNVERDKGKELNFSLVYGLGVKNLAKKLRCSVGDAKAHKWCYFQEFPEAETMSDRVQELVLERGYVMTLLGRRRRFRERRKDGYKGMNAICQGGNADIIKMKMIETDDYLRSTGYGEFGISVHDALVNFLDPAHREKASAEITQICKTFTKEQHGFKLRTNMELDEGFGTNWAEASYSPEVLAAAA
jgi:DNA polymerase I-like protein with 3'-5' exonuclease and polymerase domains